MARERADRGAVRGSAWVFVSEPREVGQAGGKRRRHGIAPAIGAACACELSEVPLGPVEVNEGAFRKYGFVHAWVPAPPDQASRQPMLIELYGAAPRAPDSFRIYVGDERDIEVPVTVVVESATYTNLNYLAYNVPLYG